MIGAWVIHQSYGRGQVTDLVGQQATVKFENGTTRKIGLTFVMAKGILTFEDDRLQQQALEQFPKQDQRVAEPVVAPPKKTTRRKHQKNTPQRKSASGLSIADLRPRTTYTHDDIVDTFHVAKMGGMRRSTTYDALVLISQHHGDPEQNPYEDRWEADGLFHYTGEGKNGDQSLTYRQNRTLNESDRNGISLYLFESSRSNEYVFVGEVMLAKPPYPEQAPDSEGKMRRVYKFPLKVK